MNLSSLDILEKILNSEVSVPELLPAMTRNHVGFARSGLPLPAILLSDIWIDSTTSYYSLRPLEMKQLLFGMEFYVVLFNG